MKRLVMWIETTLYITGICLGLRLATDEGMLLYFLRRPYDELENENQSTYDRLKYLEDNTSEIDESPGALKDSRIAIRIVELNQTKSKFKKESVQLFVWRLFKPVYLCAPCMASFHSLVWWLMFEENYSVYVIPSMLISAFLNGVGWKLFRKL